MNTQPYVYFSSVINITLNFHLIYIYIYIYNQNEFQNVSLLLYSFVLLVLKIISYSTFTLFNLDWWAPSCFAI